MKKRIILSARIILVCAVSMQVCGRSAPAAAAETREDPSAKIVRVYFSDRQTGNQIFRAFEGAMIETNYEAQYHLMEITPEDEARLIESGLDYEVDTAPQLERAAPLAAAEAEVSLETIPSYPCYETVEETFAIAEEMASDNPTLVDWVDVGDSWEKSVDLGGYDMMVLILTNFANTVQKPKLFLTCAIHSREYATAPLCLEFAEQLLDGYGVDADATWILDYHEVHIMLHANPDGRKQAESGASWRKNTNENYCSPASSNRGADLNRNFDFEWGCCGGSSPSECEQTYMGPSAASEPEVQAIQDYMRSIFPDQRDDDLDAAAPIDATGVFIDIQSYSELVLFPWGFTSETPPNFQETRTLGRKFAYFNDYVPEPVASLYTTDGITTDFCYGDLGVASFTFEIGTAFFQSCTTYDNQIVPDNIPALFYAAKVVRTPYLTPSGPNAQSLALTSSTVLAGTSVMLTASLDDTLFNNSNGTEPTQSIAAAEYYVDTPPWVDYPTPVAIPMASADGVYNSSTETVEALVDTTGWLPGQHLLFVRGRDSDNNWGAFTAIFLTIEDTGCTGDAECDDGVYCNGAESCAAGVCQAGVAVDCDDHVTCTDDACNETWYGCDHLPDDTACDDGQFCNGQESCNGTSGCQGGNDPCPGQYCDDSSDSCYECYIDFDCDDGVYCNGDELCTGGFCEEGSDPCPGQSCDETAQQCVTGPLFSDDFENGNAKGWNLFGTGSTARTGDFVIGDPVGTVSGANQAQPEYAFEGTGCAFTAQNRALSFDDVDYGVVYLVSPVIDLSSADSAELTYVRWFYNRVLGGDTGDYFAADISNDNGATWVNLETLNTNQSANLWTERLFDLESYIALTSTVRVRFGASDGPRNSDIIEAAIDNVAVWAHGSCTEDAECDDGAYCNGMESCVDGGCVAGDNPCPNALCDEETNRCVQCLADSDCSDALYCNGEEPCVNGTCEAGADVDCDDGMTCTADTCNETTDKCAHTPQDAACSDGQFCNGQETCSAISGCVVGSAPCAGEYCDEAADACYACAVDSDCDDGVACTVDRCVDHACQYDDSGCGGCASDAECDDGNFCNGQESCSGGTCVAGTNWGALCEQATLLGPNQHSGNFNTTGERWFYTTTTMNGWWAANMSGRTIYVNGIQVNPGQVPLPNQINGRRYFRFTAGDYPWAAWGFW